MINKEREELISKLKILIKLNNIKQKKYQEENKNPEIGCLTREACEMVSLYPKMQQLGVTFDDCK